MQRMGVGNIHHGDPSTRALTARIWKTWSPAVGMRDEDRRGGSEARTRGRRPRPALPLYEGSWTRTETRQGGGELAKCKVITSFPTPPSPASLASPAPCARPTACPASGYRDSSRKTSRGMPRNAHDPRASRGFVPSRYLLVPGNCSDRSIADRSDRRGQMISPPFCWMGRNWPTCPRRGRVRSF